MTQIGLNIFAVIADDANFVSSGKTVNAASIVKGLEQRMEDCVNTMGLYESKTWTRHNNEMKALAEASLSEKEVIEILTSIMERSLLSSKRCHAEVRTARFSMIQAANKTLAQHYYFLPRRKVRLEAICKRLLKGYQKWWRRVEARRKVYLARVRKTGECYNALDKAIREVSPNLFRN